MAHCNWRLNNQTFEAGNCINSNRLHITNVIGCSIGYVSVSSLPYLADLYLNASLLAGVIIWYTCVESLFCIAKHHPYKVLAILVGAVVSASSSTWSVSLHGAGMLSSSSPPPLSMICWYNTLLFSMLPIFDGGTSFYLNSTSNFLFVSCATTFANSFSSNQGLGALPVPCMVYSTQCFLSFSLFPTVAFCLLISAALNMSLEVMCLPPVTKNLLPCVCTAARASCCLQVCTTVTNAVFLTLTLSSKNCAFRMSPLYPLTDSWVVLYSRSSSGYPETRWNFGCSHWWPLCRTFLFSIHFLLYRTAPTLFH